MYYFDSKLTFRQSFEIWINRMAVGQIVLLCTVFFSLKSRVTETGILCPNLFKLLKGREKSGKIYCLQLHCTYSSCMHIQCLHSFMRSTYLSLFRKCWKIVFMFANVNSRQILFRCVTVLLLSLFPSLSRQKKHT